MLHYWAPVSPWRRAGWEFYSMVPNNLLEIGGCARDTYWDGRAVSAGRIHLQPGRDILSNALNFCRSAIAALVRSPCRYCPFRSPGGPPVPLAPPYNRQRPFFVAGDRQAFPLLVRAPVSGTLRALRLLGGGISLERAH